MFRLFYQTVEELLAPDCNSVLHLPSGEVF